MNKIEILMSTMHRKNFDFMYLKNISTNTILVNQAEEESIVNLPINGCTLKIISNQQRGLSRSRNIALLHASADICIIADDDVTYSEDYADKIISAYEQYPEADIIAFQVERIGAGSKKIFREQLSWENYITCMKISSVEITFKLDTIKKKNIRFNENLGAGGTFFMGEENVFLYDALKSGLKILYLPIKIAEVTTDESSWFNGYNQKYFCSLGAVYYNMSKKFYSFLILQFAIRKYKLYKENISFTSALLAMFEGVKCYKRDFED